MNNNIICFKKYNICIKSFNKYAFALLLSTICACNPAPKAIAQQENTQEETKEAAIAEEHKQNPRFLSEPFFDLGANDTATYFPIIKGKRVGMVVNQTSVVENDVQKHLVDFLLEKEMNIVKIFSPEHGFRGNADAGEKVRDGKDKTTGLPIKSLYGKSKKPSVEDLNGLDVVIFDIQDVGARFYTYISTMHYVMEACAEQNVKVIVLDRPNPNGRYIDGPILKPEFKSFVGMHPVPIVHGMTIGEYAQMINGENWLANGVKCDLTVVKMKQWTHQQRYNLPIKPSPNLPNELSIQLYPFLCLFEGTNVSVGRGTNKQFQVVGMPNFEANIKLSTFTPKSMPGAKYPKHENQLCKGYDFTKTPVEFHFKKKALTLDYLVNFYKTCPSQEAFFLKNGFFNKLAGTDELRKQIEAGMSESQIKKSWAEGLAEYDKMRQAYLLYPLN